MPESDRENYPLAPLQLAMLDAARRGDCIEQILLTLRNASFEQASAAWSATVEATEGLRLQRAASPGGEDRWVAAGLPASQVALASIDPGWLEGDRHLGFPSPSGILWRAAFDPKRGIFCWTLHHALFDGASMKRVTRHFLAALGGGAVPPLPWAAWPGCDKARTSRAWQIWQEWFRDLPLVRREFASSQLPSRHRIRLGADSAEALAAAADRWSVTAATMVTWAWAQVVARTAGVSAVSVGHVRRGVPVAEKAGFTMNTLPLVIPRAPDSASLGGALRETRSRMLALRDVETANPAGLAASSFNGPPWSSVLMVETETFAHAFRDHDAVLAVRLLEQSPGELNACAYIKPDLLLEVETGCLGLDRVESLAGHWAAVLRRIAAGASTGRAAAFPDAWQEKLAAWENGDPGAPTPLLEAWTQAVATHSERIAVTWDSGAWTCAGLHQRAAALAGAMRQAGINPGEPVGIISSKRFHYPLAFLAAAMAGAIYVPLDLRLPDARRAELARTAGLRFVAGDTCHPVETLGCQWLDIANGGAPPGPPPVDADQTVALLFTSGSTGTPKGVALGGASLVNEARAMAALIQLRPGDRLLQFASPGFDVSLEEMLICLLHGATLVSTPAGAGADFHGFLQRVRDTGVTILNLPTAFWESWCIWMAAEKHPFPPTVRAVIVGGERLASSALRSWHAIGGEAVALLNAYGPTEASVAATCQILNGHGQFPDADPPIGRPLAGYRIRIAGPDGEPAPPGAWGEILIGGAGLSPGYWNAPGLTEAAFVSRSDGRWYRSGDRGRWNADGLLVVGGRFDDQLKIRGQRIEPAEVVSHVERLPGVAGAFVSGHFTPAGLRLAAWIRPDKNGTPALATLREALAARLPPAAVPTHWSIVDNFPLTERGKVDSTRLPEPTVIANSRNDPPVTATERTLARMWSTLLGVEEPGTGDDFFSLGGSSLLALRLFARISAELGVRLPMAQLLKTPRLGALAAALDHRRTSPADAAEVHAVILNEKGTRPLLCCIHGGHGGILHYRELACYLPSSIPMLLIESPALRSEKNVQPDSIEVTAARYLLALRGRQASGPYHLAGYCFGGLVAYEMACQLRQQGEEIAFLGLLETDNPACRRRRRYTFWERVSVRWRSLSSFPLPKRSLAMLRRFIGGIGIHLRASIDSAAARHLEDSAPHSRLRMLKIRDAHAAIEDRYRPQPVDVPLVLFKTTGVDDKFEFAGDYGWSALVPRLKIVDVPGDHYTMFDQAHTRELAEILFDQLPAHGPRSVASKRSDDQLSMSR